ncbi:AAA family ATPase [Frigoribacterium faeni]|uniref:AAA family ATPase n=1 Tax=Frigoribacterium faeni TaxID=145483 RepID=UPI00141B228F|nr:SpoVK/Ycf46/Vps4 family AAA+-type ATPase [Frigoribacterium faeni]
MRESLIRSLRLAVEQAPDDVPLRVHLGVLELDDGDVDAAVRSLAAALVLDPRHEEARAAMARALADPAASPVSAAVGPSSGGAEPREGPRDGEPGDDDPGSWSGPHPAVTADAAAFDWETAEDDLRAASFRIDRPDLRLTDVGGMSRVKAALEQAFLAPLRNPELREAYGASLRGGLLLYGPPGCGKTHLARALAGELGASFLSVSQADLLDHESGSPARAVTDVFEAARRAAPCVLFLDEVDAVAPRRSSTDSAWARAVVNQVLVELDGVDSRNDGLFVLAATNRPWEVDPAARRPGRLDRTLLVLPPDEAARREIARTRLEGRPVGDVDLDALARATSGMSGADVGYVCDLALQRALADSVATGTPRPVTDKDLRRARSSVTPSVGEWAASARSVVTYGVDDGTFAELREFLGMRRGR